jgi:hypothetical protein
VHTLDAGVDVLPKIDQLQIGARFADSSASQSGDAIEDITRLCLASISTTLKNDIGRHLEEVELRSSPLIKVSPTTSAAVNCIAEISSVRNRSGRAGLTVRANSSFRLTLPKACLEPFARANSVLTDPCCVAVHWSELMSMLVFHKFLTTPGHPAR